MCLGALIHNAAACLCPGGWWSWVMSSLPCSITEGKRRAPRGLLGDHLRVLFLRDLPLFRSKLWKMNRTIYFLGGIWKDPGVLCGFVLCVLSQKTQVCSKPPDQTLMSVPIWGGCLSLRKPLVKKKLFSQSCSQGTGLNLKSLLSCLLARITWCFCKGRIPVLVVPALIAD